MEGEGGEFEDMSGKRVIQERFTGGAGSGMIALACGEGQNWNLSSLWK